MVRLNIKNRVFEMLEEGLVEELKKYRNKVVGCNIENAIGFKEIACLLNFSEFLQILRIFLIFANFAQFF